MSEIELYKQLIEGKLEIFRLQQGRLVSDWESEKENRENLAKRVDDAMKIMHELNSFKTIHHEKLELFDKILRNGGNGLIMDVDRLKQAKEGSKNRLALFFAIAALVMQIIDLIKDNILK